jgi:hypothetical protein
MATYDRREGEAVRQDSRAEQAYLRPYTHLQLHFLARLERLVALRNSYQTDSPREVWLLKAINRAIYSTLRDCIEAGVGEEARAILKGKNRVN